MPENQNSDSVKTKVQEESCPLDRITTRNKEIKERLKQSPLRKLQERLPVRLQPSEIQSKKIIVLDSQLTKENELN